MSFRKLLATALVASMVFGLFGTAFAQPSASDAFYDQAAEILKHFSIIIGDPSGDMRYGDSISRAEMITVLIRSLGKEGDANLLRGAPAFSDTATHWSSGYVALAKNAGLTTGFPDGTFKPDAQMTYAQAITFLVRLVGIEPTSTEWPAGYVQAAVQAGIIPQDAAALRAVDAPAIRGDVFVMLAKSVSEIKLATGKTLLQTYFDSTPPTLVIDQVDAVTTRSSVTISGTAGDAVGVFVDGEAVALADGSFSADVPLQIGANEIWITAIDLVGNEASKTVAIERQNTAAASIEVVGDLTVEAGGTADLKVVVLDSNGAPIPDALIDVESEVGTWADGIFTAGTAAGTGVLTLISGDAVAEVDVTVTAGPLASLVVTPDQEVASTNALVKFTAVGNDQYGNEVAVSGVQWSASSGVIDQNGNLAATASGEVIVTAKVGDITGTGKVTVFGQAAALKLELAGGLTANGRSTTTATATVVDTAGNRVKSYTGVINFNSSNAASVVIDPNLQGKSVVASEGVAQVTLKSAAANQTGTAVISVSAEGLVGANAVVTPVQQQLAKVVIFADPPAMSATTNTTLPIRVKGVDQNGVAIPATSPSLAGIQGRLASSNTAVATFNQQVESPVGTNISFTDDDNILLAAPTLFATLTATNTPGSVTISGSFTQNGVALTVPVEALTVNTFISGAPAKIAVDEVKAARVGLLSNGNNIAGVTADELNRDHTQYVTIRVYDVNGNVVSDMNNLTVLLEAVGSDTGSVINGTSVNPRGGDTPRYSLNGKVVFAVRTNKAQTITYTAKAWFSPAGVAPTLIGAVSASAQISGGEIANVQARGDTRLAVNIDGNGNGTGGTQIWINADGVSTVKLTARLRDEGNNRVSEGSFPVTFRKTIDNNATAAFTETTVNSVNGEASVDLRATTTGNVADTYQITAKISPNQTLTATIDVRSVAMGSPNRVILYRDNGATPNNTAGVESNWVAYVADANGNPVGTDNGRTINFRITRMIGTGTVEVHNATATTNKGVATFTFTHTTASTSYQATAWSAGLTNSAVIGAYTITADTPSKLYLEADTVDGVAADGVSFAGLLIRSRDRYNNNVAFPAGTVVRLEVPSTIYGGFAQGGTGNPVTQFVNIAPVNPTTHTLRTNGHVPQNTATEETIAGANDFVASNQPGTVVITATAAGTTLAPATLEMPVYLAGQPVGIKVVPEHTSRGAGYQSTMKVALVDANGRHVTNPNAAFAVRITAIAPDFPTQATFVNYEGVNVNPVAANPPAQQYSVATFTLGAGQAAPFNRGFVRLRTNSLRGQSITYSAVHDVGTPTLTGGQAAVSWTGSPVAAQLQVIQDSNTTTPVGNVSAVNLNLNALQVGGNVTSLTFRVVDGNGNPVTSATGNVTVTVQTGSQYVTLSTTSVAISGGQGTMQVQSTNTAGSATLRVTSTLPGMGTETTGNLLINT